jgi:SAM-dependent methyltransferase
MLSPLDLYELCVQKPALLAPLLRAIHGRSPRTLAEDFCGSAALSRHWCRSDPKARAVGVDLDAATLAYARARAKGLRRLTLVRADVTKPLPRGGARGSARAGAAAARVKPDLIFVGNFSIGEIHDRAALVEYLRRCRRRLARHGVFVCDTYGGESAFRTGAVQRTHDVPNSHLRVRYTWQQRSADPITARVENALHFRVDDRGEITQELTDAFVYRWRLWSLAELRDAMRDAGFRTVEVYGQVPDAEDSDGNVYVRPIDDPADLDASYIVCVAARA